MTTVNLSQTGTPEGHVSISDVRVPYLISFEVTGAAAVAAKGSALADADILQILDLPADILLLGAGIEVTTADTDGSADILFNMGIGGAVDIFVDGGDVSSTGYLAAGSNGALDFQNGIRVTSADTLDIVLDKSSSFSSNDDWVVRVYAVILDIDAKPAAGAAIDVA